MGLAIFLLCVDAPFLLILLVQVLNRRVLWKVRSRLIVTYLLMGFAPLVLFITLTLIVGYGLAGQYSVNSALSSLDEAAGRLRGETADAAGTLIQQNVQGDPAKILLQNESEPFAAETSLAKFENGTWHSIQLVSRRGPSPVSPFEGLAKPEWLVAGTHKIVVLNGKLYLCADSLMQQNNRQAETLGALELKDAALDSMGTSLGRVLIFSAFSRGRQRDIDQTAIKINTDEEDINFGQESRDAAQQDEPKENRPATPTVGKTGVPDPSSVTGLPKTSPTRRKNSSLREGRGDAARNTGLTSTDPPTASARPAPPVRDPGAFHRVSGGTVPPASHLFDQRMYFTAPLPIVEWQDGVQQSAVMVVISRPSLLYTRLFATSVVMGSVLRTVLVAVGIFFGFLELLALWMAISLSRTITRSVAGLYRGTTEIDSGNLAYRVKPVRQDQLGALAVSFNTMAGSIQDLLEQQREKERMLSELAIAEEVQRNLFPHSPVSRSGLDLHAVCLPARTVSGDYFDFIFKHDGSICIALGDISGKGISAALLMASLHSAVRAFSVGDEVPAPSPAHLLGLLNQHLFTSTQTNKYATLFLAFYHPASRRLTYTNGGHLPPFLISRDGTVQRLEAGGSVVGLLEGLQYEEASVELQPGDLLAVFSDGLTEPEQGSTEFAEDRLLSVIRGHRADALPAIVDGTFHALQEWIGEQEQPDDMTLLLARQH